VAAARRRVPGAPTHCAAARRQPDQGADSGHGQHSPYRRAQWPVLSAYRLRWSPAFPDLLLLTRRCQRHLHWSRQSWLLGLLPPRALDVAQPCGTHLPSSSTRPVHMVPNRSRAKRRWLCVVKR
jgi:hypothetical protein